MTESDNTHKWDTDSEDDTATTDEADEELKPRMLSAEKMDTADDELIRPFILDLGSCFQ